MINLRGFTLQTYWYQEFQNQEQVIGALTNMKNMGANFVQIGYEHYQPNVTSNVITNSIDINPADVPASIVASQAQVSATINGVTGLYYPFQLNSPAAEDVSWVIRLAVSMGFIVGVKPQIDCSDGTPWRALIAPTNPGAPGIAGSWFDSYNTFIVAQAALAQAAGATYFSVGNENVSMAQAEYDSQWQAIIANVRAVFSGKLTYASAGFGSPSETMVTGMWEYLDYAGVDFYPELLSANVIPTTATPVSEAVAGFASNYSGIDYLTAMQAFMVKAGKPIIITETGTTNWNGACYEPWQSGWNSNTQSVDNGPSNEVAQALYWEALLQWLDDNAETIPIYGIAGWMWRASTTDGYLTGYSIWDRLAYTPVAAWFKAKSILEASMPVTSTAPSYPSTPASPTIGIVGTLTLGEVYGYQIVSVNAAGHSLPSAVVSSTPGTTKTMLLSWSINPNTLSTQIYRNGYFLAEVTNNYYLDVGSPTTSDVVGSLASIDMILPINIDLNNPYYNVFLTDPYSGSHLTAAYTPSTKKQTIGTDIASVLTPYAKFIINSVVESFNSQYGTNYDPTLFGIASIPNNQNSNCAYIVFPLDPTISLVIRVYMELGNNIDIGFNFIDFVDTPQYISASTSNY